MPVRVLLFLPTDLEADASGGIRTFVRDFVKYSPDDFEIDVIGATFDARARPVGRWRNLAFGRRQARLLPLIHVPAGRDGPIPRGARYLAALLAHRSWLPLAASILQFHRPGLALAFVAHRGPLVQWLHLDPLDGVAETKWRLLPGLFRLVEARTMARVDRIYLPSAAGADLYQRRYPKLADRVRYMPTWHDPERFRPTSSRQRLAARRALAKQTGLAIPARARLVLFVGRLEAVKDPALLIAAFADLAEQMADAQLLIVGDGPLRKATQQWAAAAGTAAQVHFAGSHAPDEVALFMRAAEVLLVTSRSESSGRVGLEALASGLPVVSTSVGEMPTVIRHRDTGWLVTERTPSALGAGLRWALQQPLDERAASIAASVADYVPATVLAELYADHRRLAASRARSIHQKKRGSLTR